MMLIVLLFSTAIISYLFFRAAVFMETCRKTLASDQNTVFINKHPNWYSYLRISLPIIIFAFYFNALVSGGAFVYFIVRWLSDV